MTETLPKAHILVVDDDTRLRALLVQYLSDQGYAVSQAESAAHASECLSLLMPDMMVLDVMMPGQTGLEYADHLRQQQVKIPILMLTAMGEAQDRISGLEAGVQDYLTKPFEPRELVLRVQNILSNHAKPAPKQMLKLGQHHYYLQLQQLRTQADQPIALSSSEHELLRAMVQQSGYIISREQLANMLDCAEDSRTIDVQISRLRKRLDDSNVIRTLRGKGYQLVVG